MKKFSTNVISQVIYYSLLGAMIFGTLTGQADIISISVAALWVVIVLGCIFGALTAFVAYGSEKVRDEKARAETLDSVREIVKRKKKLTRYWGWFCMAMVIAMLAYSGWVFTAVCYVLSSLFVTLCIYLAREKVEELTIGVMA